MKIMMSKEMEGAKAYIFSVLNKNLLFNTILPIFVSTFAIPLLMTFASLHIICTVGILMVLVSLLIYGKNLLKICPFLSHYFFMWSFVSIIYLWIFFENTMVDGTVLKRERYTFIWSLFGAFLCFYIVSHCFRFEISFKS